MSRQLAGQRYAVGPGPAAPPGVDKEEHKHDEHDRNRPGDRPKPHPRGVGGQKRSRKPADKSGVHMHGAVSGQRVKAFV